MAKHPKQHRQVIRHNRRSPSGNIFEPPLRTRDSRPLLAQKPLTAAAGDLLREFIRRDTFHHATEYGFPVAWAGEEVMKVRKKRAYEILREIVHCGGAERWFRGEALRLMEQ